MANCATAFAYANEEECFAIVESVCGTLKKPGADDRMYTVGPVSFKQSQDFLDDEQIRASASMLAPIKGLKRPGDWNFNTYVKPSGSPGTAPEHDVLFQCAMGTKTVNAGTSVVYTLANQLDSFSLWVKKGHTVYAFRGCGVEQPEVGVNGEEVAGIGWSGKYMEQLWAGTCYANDTCNIAKATIQLRVPAAQRYVEGMYVNVGTDTNGGAGYRLTDVNYTNDTITISPTLATNQGANPEITPWLPTASAEVGAEVHGKQGIVTVGGKNAVILSARVTLKNNLKYYDMEKNNTWTAERFGRPGRRAVDGELEMFYLTEGPSYFYRAEYEVSDALVIPIGNVAGYIMNISIPYARYETPEISGDEEFIENVPFKAIASASLNDELAITFQ